MMDNKKILSAEELKYISGGYTDATYKMVGWIVEAAKNQGYTLEEFLDAYGYRGTESEAVIRELW